MVAPLPARQHVPYHVIWDPTYCEQVERLERGGVNTIGKEHFTFLFSHARKKAFTPKNIIAGFAASGLFPFNPDRVLRSMPKPVVELTVPKADEVNVRACSQNEAPQTPVTPVSVEGLMSLQNLIIAQDARALDETSKQDLQRHLEKYAKAAQLSFAKGALQQNHIQFLLKVSDEAKVRQSTKPVILGRAKVMGYDELKEAREKRAETEAAKAQSKGKRGGKRTSTALEADVVAPKPKAARVSKAPKPATSLTSQRSGTPIVEGGTAPVPWRAPVARMYYGHSDYRKEFFRATIVTEETSLLSATVPTMPITFPVIVLVTTSSLLCLTMFCNHVTDVTYFVCGRHHPGA